MYIKGFLSPQDSMPSMPLSLWLGTLSGGGPPLTPPKEGDANREGPPLTPPKEGDA